MFAQYLKQLVYFIRNLAAAGAGILISVKIIHLFCNEDLLRKITESILIWVPIIYWELCERIKGLDSV